MGSACVPGDSPGATLPGEASCSPPWNFGPLKLCSDLGNMQPQANDTANWAQRNTGGPVHAKYILVFKI